jgi:hypothetical protein
MQNNNIPFGPLLADVSTI